MTPSFVAGATDTLIKAADADRDSRLDLITTDANGITLARSLKAMEFGRRANLSVRTLPGASLTGNQDSAPVLAMQVTYYLEVTSSWCFWAEPVWAELKRRYAGRVAFDWKIAKMNPADFPSSHRQYDWFLRRSAAITGADFVPSSAYYDVPAEGGYPAASAVAEGARSLGLIGDEVRCALSHAAYRNGRKIGRIDVAIDVAVEALSGRLDPLRLRERALSADIAARLDATTAEFRALQVTQRPTFVLENSIGDKAVFSGLVRAEPLFATLDAMLADVAAYAAYRESFGVPPP